MSTQKTKCTAEELLAAISPQLAEDILLALRYNYYVRARPSVPDHHYDAAEREFMFRDNIPEASPMNQPGSDDVASYPSRVVALSLYFCLCRGDDLARKPVMTDKAVKPESSQVSLFSSSGKILHGCVDAIHTDRLVTPSESAFWHAKGKMIRRAELNHLKSLGKKR